MANDFSSNDVRGSVGQRLGLIFIVLVATVPFLGKAFHIDDPLYLAVARQIIAKPWDPYGSEILWERSRESLFDADFNPPFWSYLVAGVLVFTGEPEVDVIEQTTAQGSLVYHAKPPLRVPEVALHTLEGLFIAAAICFLYALSRRWVRWPVTATALVALGPAMLPGHNLMLEGPVMAFWLGAVWCYLRGVDRDDARWTWIAGVLAALAVMTKYTSGLIVLLIAADVVRRRRWRDLWLLAPTVVCLAFWSLHNWWVYERLHVLVIFARAQTGGRESVGIRWFESWGRLLAVFRATGATTALAIPIIVNVARRFGTWAALLLILAALGVGWLGKIDMAMRLFERDGRARASAFPDSVATHVVAFGALGAIALCGLVVSSWRAGAGKLPSVPTTNERRGEEFFLWTWTVLVIVFAIMATPFLAVRHLLPCVPPITWLTLRRLDEWLDAGVWQRLKSKLLAVTACISTISGLLVARADYEFANWYRHLALDVASRTVEAARQQGKEVWYTGHWGWAYYAERAGMKPYLPGETQMGEGDFLLLPQVQTWQLPPKELYQYLKGLMPPIRPTPRAPRWTGWATFDGAVHWCLSGVRSISNEVHYYGCGTLTVPWRFSRRPLDFFNVIEVRYDTARMGSGDVFVLEAKADVPVMSAQKRPPTPSRSLGVSEPMWGGDRW